MLTTFTSCWSDDRSSLGTSPCAFDRSPGSTAWRWQVGCREDMAFGSAWSRSRVTAAHTVAGHGFSQDVVSEELLRQGIIKLCRPCIREHSPKALVRLYRIVDVECGRHSGRIASHDGALIDTISSLSLPPQSTATLFGLVPFPSHSPGTVEKIVSRGLGRCAERIGEYECRARKPCRSTRHCHRV